MKRLREGQHVWLCSATRDGPSRQCVVVAAYGSSVALHPFGDAPFDRSAGPAELFLVFEHAERPIALRGEIVAAGEDLRFVATDGVLVSQQAAPLLAKEVPIELIATDRPYAEPVQGVTATYSADGAVLKDAGDLKPGERVKFTFAPSGEFEISGRGEMLPISGGRFAVAFLGLDPGLRGRMVEHVIATKRRRAAGRIASRTAGMSA